MGKARFGTAIGGIGATIGAIGAIGAFQIVHEHGAAAFHYRSYRTAIGEGTIGLSELSEYYRSTIGVLSESTIGTIGPGLRLHERVVLGFVPPFRHQSINRSAPIGLLAWRRRDPGSRFSGVVACVRSV